MTVQLLIDSIVRQVTVLLAQLATSGGVRAPVAHIANQVFLDLANELHAQGISRKVSADMFGMALRTYVRKLRRLTEGQTDAGQSLWQGVLEFIKQGGLVTRDQVLHRFSRDGELQVNAILRDLTESGLVFGSGAGAGTVYRLASADEMHKLSQLSSGPGLDELVLALVYRFGPCSTRELQEQLGRPLASFEDALQRLIAAERLQFKGDRYHAPSLILPIGSSVGWEAAVFDHVQAVVQTICQRLAHADAPPSQRDIVGGSTFTCEVWPGHPLEEEVKTQLEALRQRCHEVRQRVTDYNVEHGVKPQHEKIITYVGQCVLERDVEDDPEGGMHHG